jgi:dihydrofolate synthase/folylpolyglutamate synthase
MNEPGETSIPAASAPPARLTYPEAIEFWFGRINYEQRAPRPIDLTLDRMKHLLDSLGSPQERLRIIHVAGSKGKGSTSAMLASILRRAGYRAGLFTSPHLVHVEERIQVDGQPILPDELAAILSDIAQALRGWPLERLQPPTFFEIATALGFLHFVRRRVDVAVVEVGLGGRFDSTNVCMPEISLITSISFDHTQQLGNDLGSIAMEKAGIVKRGRPAISGATNPEARQVIERICRERGAPLWQLGRDFSYRYEPGQPLSLHQGRNRQATASDPAPCLPRVSVGSRSREWPPMTLGLLGEHQAANAAVAVCCVEQLRERGWTVHDEAVIEGLERVCWPARQEILGRRPWIMLDCAHNVASIEALVCSVSASFPESRRYLVFAASNDKDIPGMFRALGSCFTHIYLTRYAHSQRCVAPEDLQAMLQRSAAVPSTVYATAAQALEAARGAAGPEDLVCIAGSVFLAGELRPILKKDEVRWKEGK